MGLEDLLVEIMGMDIGDKKKKKINIFPLNEYLC